MEGWRRTLGAPAAIAGVSLVTFAAALPLAIVVYTVQRPHLGASVGAHARGVATTFTDDIVGFGGTLATLRTAFDGGPLHPGVAIAAAAYLVLWIFVSGGILDRFARARALGTVPFLTACGTYFGRFVRIAAVTGLGYWAIFAWFYPFLFETLSDQETRDLSAATPAMWWRAALYATIAIALMVIGLVTDFAKVRTVVEDRRSMVAALIASLRFVRRRSGRVMALYLMNTGTAITLAGVWIWLDPPSSWAPWIAFAVAPPYLVVRLTAKLAFLASEIVFFQGELAHPHDIAAAEAVWPDAQAVETIR